jgi:hypothetical protein
MDRHIKRMDADLSRARDDWTATATAAVENVSFTFRNSMGPSDLQSKHRVTHDGSLRHGGSSRSTLICIALITMLPYTLLLSYP